VASDGGQRRDRQEVKDLRPQRFLIERYKRWPRRSTTATARWALKRAVWGGAFTALGTIGYYAAYAYIACVRSKANSHRRISPFSPDRSSGWHPCLLRSESCFLLLFFCLSFFSSFVYCFVVVVVLMFLSSYFSFISIFSFSLSFC